MKLWIGKEREGVYSGLKTLFIGSPDIEFYEIEDVLSDKRFKIEQLYFGAGRCSDIDQEVVRQCLNEFAPKGIIITMEIDFRHIRDYDEKLLQQCYIIASMNRFAFGSIKRLNRETAQIKLQCLMDYGEKILVMAKLSDFSETSLETLKGKTYQGDVVIK